VLVIIAIATAAQAGISVAQAAENYGRFRARGETAMADLAAIEVALGFQEGTVDYFMAYIALDVLLE
jgi:hypothetical protein